LIRLTVMIIVGFKYHLYITSFNSYRDGDRRCQHFECNYFISYRTDNIDADIELSGKSNGWVAIGFSSDKKMVSYFNREITPFCKYFVGGNVYDIIVSHDLQYCLKCYLKYSNKCCWNFPFNKIDHMCHFPFTVSIKT
jgi:hypothetical protein